MRETRHDRSNEDMESFETYDSRHLRTRHTCARLVDRGLHIIVRHSLQLDQWGLNRGVVVESEKFQPGSDGAVDGGSSNGAVEDDACSGPAPERYGMSEVCGAEGQGSR